MMVDAGMCIRRLKAALLNARVALESLLCTCLDRLDTFAEDVDHLLTY